MRLRDKITQLLRLGNGFLFLVAAEESRTDKGAADGAKIEVQKALKYSCLLADISVEYMVGM